MEKLENVGQEFNITEMQAQNAPTENIDWVGKDISVESDPLIDYGSGSKIVVRNFKLKFAPGMPERPSSKDILEHYKNNITVFLYKDGLEQVGDAKVVYDKKDKDVFYIFVPCKALPGMSIDENPHLIHDLWQKPRRKK